MKDNYNILLMNIGARHRKIATLQVGSIMVCRFPMQKAKKRYINAIEVDWSKDSIRRNGQSEVPKDRKLNNHAWWNV